jgi:hypothetical protein
VPAGSRVPFLTLICPREIVRRRWRRERGFVTDARLKITLGTGLLVGAIALAVTLSQSPVTVAGVSTVAQANIGSSSTTTSECEPGGTLPSATTGIRLRAFAFLGSRVAVEVLEHGRVITRGGRGSGWTAGAVTVPVRPLARTRLGVELCFALFVNGDETENFVGESTAGALAAHATGDDLSGRVRAEYLRPGRSSWWSLALSVARRMGLGHAWPGTWSVLLVIALMGGVAVLCWRAILRGLQ